MSKGGSRLASRCSCQGGWPATSSGCRLVSGNFQRMQRISCEYLEQEQFGVGLAFSVPMSGRGCGWLI